MRELVQRPCRETGSATIEIAILTPFLIAVMFAIAGIGQAMTARLVAQWAAQEGARVAAVQGADLGVQQAQLTLQDNQRLLGGQWSGAPSVSGGSLRGEPVVCRVAGTLSIPLPFTPISVASIEIDAKAVACKE